MAETSVLERLSLESYAMGLLGWRSAAFAALMLAALMLAALMLAASVSAQSAPGEPRLDGTLARYVALALARSPEARAAQLHWEAARHRESRAGTFPDPSVAVGVYARPVETRVGPQRLRVSVRQDLPWPTGPRAEARAQGARARAAKRRFEARALAIRAEVASAWWALWWVRRARSIHSEQIVVLEGLAEAASGRVATDHATLADVAQIQVRRARHENTVATLASQERMAESALGAALGGRPEAFPTTSPAPLARPAETAQSLLRDLEEHPELDALSALAQAQEAEADALRAEGLPRFSLGLDWVVTADARSEGVPGSGDDALIVQLGLRVPLWQGAYRAGPRAARASAQAQRAEREGTLERAQAAVLVALEKVHDSYRRALFHRDTLRPQALAAYESVLGSYVAGRVAVASLLLAQKELLDLALGEQQARAEHGAAWAELERVVGRPVTPEPFDA